MPWAFKVWTIASDSPIVKPIAALAKPDNVTCKESTILTDGGFGTVVSSSNFDNLLSRLEMDDITSLLFFVYTQPCLVAFTSASGYQLGFL